MRGNEATRQRASFDARLLHYWLNIPIGYSLVLNLQCSVKVSEDYLKYA